MLIKLIKIKILFYESESKQSFHVHFRSGIGKLLTTLQSTVIYEKSYDV